MDRLTNMMSFRIVASRSGRRFCIQVKSHIPHSEENRHTDKVNSNGVMMQKKFIILTVKDLEDDLDDEDLLEDEEENDSDYYEDSEEDESNTEDPDYSDPEDDPDVQDINWF